MKNVAFAAAALIVSATALPAAAATVIDFDHLPNGTTLPVNSSTAMTTQYASLGVTFTASLAGVAGTPTATNYSGGQPVTSVYEVNYLTNHAVPTDYMSTILATKYDLLSINFSTAVNDVSFGLNTFSTQSFGTFNVYDTNNVLLQSVVLSANGGWTLKTLTASNIGRIDITASALSPFVSTLATIGIDHLTFTPVAAAAVPEPASWALMLAGFGLVGGALRRRSTVRATVSFA